MHSSLSKFILLQTQKSMPQTVFDIWSGQNSTMKINIGQYLRELQIKYGCGSCTMHSSPLISIHLPRRQPLCQSVSNICSGKTLPGGIGEQGTNERTTIYMPPPLSESNNGFVQTRQASVMPSLPMRQYYSDSALHVLSNCGPLVIFH